MKRLLVFAICNFLLLIVSHPVHSADYMIFGPELFKTSKGKPYTQETTFTSRITGPQAKLVIVNGDETGKHRVSSGTITLNGEEIVSHSAFNQKVAQIERPVSLELTNKLSVKLASAPDSTISVRIIGNYPAPTITIMSPLDQDVVLSPTSLVRGRVETAAEYVEISVNGERALMSGKEFFINAIPLNQGENTITVVMEDSNRMAAQAEVTVFREEGTGNIELVLDEPGGFSPLDTRLTAKINLPHAIVEDSAALVCEGPAKAAIRPTSATEFGLRFDIDGLYACSYNVTDSQGGIHSQQAMVTVVEPFTETQWVEMENGVQDLEDFFKATLARTDITAARQKVLRRALENTDFTNVTISAGALCLVYQGKIPIILDLPDPNGPVTEGSGGGISSQSMDTQASTAPLDGDNELKYPGNDKILMYAPGYSGWGTGDEDEEQDLIADDAVDFFEGAKSYSAHLPITLLQDHQASVEAVRRFDKYGTVIINTHGWWWKYISGDIYGDDIPNYEGPTPVFRTGTVYSSNNILEDKYDTDLLLHRLAISKMPKGGNFHYVVFPSFVKRYVSKLPDTFFYLGYCHSLQNDKMWNVLKSKGAKVSFGFSEEVLLTFDATKFEELMSLMLPDSVSREPLTAREAYNAIQNKTDTGHIGARFEMRVASSEWNDFVFLDPPKGYIVIEVSLSQYSSQSNFIMVWDIGKNDYAEIYDRWGQIKFPNLKSRITPWLKSHPQQYYSNINWQPAGLDLSTIPYDQQSGLDCTGPMPDPPTCGTIMCYNHLVTTHRTCNDDEYFDFPEAESIGNYNYVNHADLLSDQINMVSCNSSQNRAEGIATQQDFTDDYIRYRNNVRAGGTSNEDRYAFGSYWASYAGYEGRIVMDKYYIYHQKKIYDDLYTYSNPCTNDWSITGDTSWNWQLDSNTKWTIDTPFGSLGEVIIGNNTIDQGTNHYTSTSDDQNSLRINRVSTMDYSITPNNRFLKSMITNNVISHIFIYQYRTNNIDVTMVNGGTPSSDYYGKRVILVQGVVDTFNDTTQQNPFAISMNPEFSEAIKYMIDKYYTYKGMDSSQIKSLYYNVSIH